MTGTVIQPGTIKDILSGILACLIIIASMYIIPVVGVFAWVFLPLPVMFYRLKTGRNSGGLIAMVSLTVLIVFTSNLAFNTIYFGSLLLTGFFMGEFIEKHMGIEKIMLYTSLCVMGTCAAVLLIYSVAQPLGIENSISNVIANYKGLSAQLFAESAQLYPEMKIDPKKLEQASSLFVLILPAIFICSYLTMIWLNILLIKKLLLKKGIVVKSIENLTQWKAPDHLVFGLIALSILMFLPLASLKLFIVNGLIILMFVYFFQGIAVVSFFFHKKSAPLGLRFFFYVLISVQPIFMLLVMVFGLFDTWINFRKLDTVT